ncbi:hypothetical protein THRCLA_08583 [Thraustotheca clavata]|uniref:Putative auto-transporter adhesin head GIN domain-containing protein n=1 Tax=Thraustotheca clavata TaxID=74557 RepID=A0A1V9Z4M2_9STRA|nr:hypothetical protein THRCLA_08583 [Thraustotheca clavata]
MDSTSWYQKTYSASTQDISGLILHTQANFIQANAAGSVPTITFRTNSQVFLNAFHPEETKIDGSFNVIVVSLDEVVYQEDNLEAKYIVDIRMPENSLKYLQAFGDAVVGKHVLRNSTDHDVKIYSLSDADVFVQDTSLFVHRLSLEASGSSNLQVDIDYLKAASEDGLNVQVTGSADTTLFTSTLDISHLDVSVSGSSSLYATGVLTQTTSVATAASGSSDIKYDITGSCNQQTITATGSSDAFTSSLKCEKTEAIARSSSDIYASATKSFSATRSSSSDIYFVGSPVESMSGIYSIAATEPTHSVSKHPLPVYEPATIIYGNGDQGIYIAGDKNTILPNSGVNQNDLISLFAVVGLVVFIYCCFRNCCKKTNYEQLPMMVIMPNQQTQQYNSIPQYSAPPQLVVQNDGYQKQ